MELRKSVLFLSLFCSCYATGEYSIEKMVDGRDKVFLPQNMIRQDKFVLYGTIKFNSSASTSKLELTLEKSGLKMQSSVELPTTNLKEFGLFSLGERHAVFIYAVKENKSDIAKIRGFVVDVVFDEKFVIELPSDFPLSDFKNIIIHEDEFDIFTNHSSICKESKVCRISFDQEGNKIGKPVAFPAEKNWEELIIGPSQPYLLMNGFFIRFNDVESREWNVTFVDQNGIVKFSFKEPENARYPASNTYKLFSICGIQYKYWKEPRNAICVQYDWRSGKMMNSSTPVDENVVDIAVTNLPTGGYVFSTTHCDDSSKCDSFNVNVVTNGTSVQKGPYPLNLDCGEMTGDLPHSAIAEIDNEFCFLFFCEDARLQTQFKYYSKCFPKNFFLDAQA